LDSYASAYTQKCKKAYNIFEVIIMTVKDVVAKRFEELCRERNIKLNELANISGVTPSTAYSMMDENRRDVSIITIKKFCDGLDITLGEFFSTSEFDNLEQELK
jgi:DNA-binding Xre family transcriptional regulator